jgi:hypothetical protein
VHLLVPLAAPLAIADLRPKAEDPAVAHPAAVQPETENHSEIYNILIFCFRHICLLLLSI